MLRATYFDGGTPDRNFTDRVEFDVIIVGFGSSQIGVKWPVEIKAIYYKLDGGRYLQSAPINMFVNCSPL